MSLLKETLANIFYKSQHPLDDKEKYIFYKIIDSYFSKGVEHYTIQCINKKSMFHAKINEIVFDTDILYGFHPIQACYIGMEYAKQFKTLNITSEKNYNAVKDNCISRYGIYTLVAQDRKGDISFVKKGTQKQFVMNPRDIALSKELIVEFDASEAFHIGFLAGLKLHNPVKDSLLHQQKRSYLRIVK